MFENEPPRWLPGQEPVELQKSLAAFFDHVDRAFPDRLIVWANWDHANWDRNALALCRALGYSRGAAFLTAYGYGIDTGDQLIPARPRPEEPEPSAKTEALPEQPAEDVAGVQTWLTGSVSNILPNNNSGFVRGDNGRDYYFNIRSFTHRVKLSLGLRVRFRTEERMDHKYKRLRQNAVELTVIT